MFAWIAEMPFRELKPTL